MRVLAAKSSCPPVRFIAKLAAWAMLLAFTVSSDLDQRGYHAAMPRLASASADVRARNNIRALGKIEPVAKRSIALTGSDLG